MVSFKNITTLLAAALSLVRASPIHQGRVLDAPGGYIVALRDHVSANDMDLHLKWIRDIHERSLGRRDLGFAGVEITYTGASGFNAYAGHFDNETLERIKNSSEVAYVEKEQMYYPAGLVTQKDSTHGLSTISHRQPGATEYVYDESAGEGAIIYVIDSGIQISHIEFEGRASHGYNAVKNTPNGDFVGHGTHIAGSAGGKTYGVAKKAKLVDVKLFHEGGSTTSVTLDAMNWAINDVIEKKIQKRAILNMSFGGEYSQAQNDLIKKAYDNGILCVIAAGNSFEDASTWSPASSRHGITVGAVDAKWRLWGFSNHGPALHILAPGADITSAHIGDSNTETFTGSGTSCAAPHVAGLAAYLAVHENINSVKELKERILSLGTRGKASELKPNTINLVSFNGVQ